MNDRIKNFGKLKDRAMNTFFNFNRIKYCAFIIIAFVLFNITVANCQITFEVPTGIKAKVTGTGRTTGHIADLKLTNGTEEEYQTSLGPFYIPSSGQYQPYIVPAQINVTVPPDATINIPMKGYCTDIHKPPVGSGEDLPPVTSWIIPGVITDQWEPDENDGWIPKIITVPPSEGKGENLDNIVTLIPGTAQPLTHTIDQYKYPGATAPVLLKSINLIATAFDSLKNSTNFLTPFSGNPEKERESVIQQTFWIFASGISGDEYNKEQFEAKMTGQFENQTGKSIDMIPKETKEKFDQGVDDFWNTFNLVGAEAKVTSNGNSEMNNQVPSVPGTNVSGLKQHTEKDTSAKRMGAEAITSGQNPVIQNTKPITPSGEEPSHMIQHKDKIINDGEKTPPKSSSDNDSKPHCKCSSFKGKLSTDQGLKETVDFSPDMSKVNPKQEIIYPRVDFEAPKDKTKPKEFSVTISDLKLDCDCEKGKCDMLAAEDDEFGKDEKYSISIASYEGVSYEGSSKIKTSGAHEYKFKSTVKSDDIKISFKLASYCKSEECDKKMCKATIVLSFKDEDDSLKKKK